MGGPWWVAVGGVGSETCAWNLEAPCGTCGGGCGPGRGGRESGCGKECGKLPHDGRCRSSEMECRGEEGMFHVCRW